MLYLNKIKRFDVFCYLANIRRSSGFCAAGMFRMTCRSYSDRLVSKVSVIRLLSGESPPGCSSALELSMLGLVRVMSSLLAAHIEETRSHTCSTKGADGSDGRRTGWTKTESARRAETPASDSGSQRKFFILHSGLILAGWHQQANVSVQLYEQAVLQHPHHHLN